MPFVARSLVRARDQLPTTTSFDRKVGSGKEWKEGFNGCDDGCAAPVVEM
jgi:hypothetical protein